MVRVFAREVVFLCLFMATMAFINWDGGWWRELGNWRVEERGVLCVMFTAKRLCFGMLWMLAFPKEEK